jgi:hypothetical protein
MAACGATELDGDAGWGGAKVVGTTRRARGRWRRTGWWRGSVVARLVAGSNGGSRQLRDVPEAGVGGRVAAWLGGARLVAGRSGGGRRRPVRG